MDYELIKSIGGPFIGAGLAFATNWWFQNRKRCNDNTTAGNLALFTLTRQASDTYNVRRALRREFARKLAQQPEAPDWVLASPMPFTFDEGAVFDFPDLAFLADDSTGRTALRLLLMAQQRHSDLRARLGELHVSAIELQKASVPIWRDNINATYADMERDFGPELVARVRAQLRAVVVRTECDPETYESAFSALDAALTERFGKKIWKQDIRPLPQFEVRNLPALPEALRLQVEEASKEKVATSP